MGSSFGDPFGEVYDDNDNNDGILRIMMMIMMIIIMNDESLSSLTPFGFIIWWTIGESGHP